MKLFDAHCHLQSSDVFERAAALGIAGMTVCGTSSNDWKNVLKLAEKFPDFGKEKCSPMQFVPMLGIHPWFVGSGVGAETPPKSVIMDRGCNWKKDFQTLEKTVCDFPMLGIGETGLDFQSRFTNRSEQEASFATHLDLACELDRPIAVHCVQAWGRMIELLKKHPVPRVLLHAYSGSAELIPELIKLNGWFSFGPSVMNSASKRAREAVVAVPAVRLLIETDLVDEPETLIAVAGAVAKLRSVPVEKIARLTFDNAQNLFFQLHENNDLSNTARTDRVEC